MAGKPRAGQPAPEKIDGEPGHLSVDDRGNVTWEWADDETLLADDTFGATARLQALTDPSLAIREEFTAFNVETKDGQNITGFIAEQTPSAVTMTDVSGKRLVLPRRDIESLQASALSLMPDGLLDALQPQEVRDLFAYVRKRP